MAEGVLGVVEVVLVHHPGIRVTQHPPVEVYEVGFLGFIPITLGSLDTHEGDAHGFIGRPCDPTTSDVSVAGFKVMDKLLWASIKSAFKVQ